jgi:DUF971 family protein
VYSRRRCADTAGAGGPQVGKQNIEIKSIEPVGAYAVSLTFSDGHDTGIYSWDYLYELGENHAALWDRYVSRMAAAGASREPLAGAPERPKAK